MTRWLTTREAAQALGVRTEDLTLGRPLRYRLVPRRDPHDKRRLRWPAERVETLARERNAVPPKT